MTCYVVTFEVSTEATREKIRALLKTFGGYCPIHANCWAITTSNTAAQVRDQIMAAVGPIDRVFVIRSGTEAAWINSYGEDNNKWLKSNL